MFGISKKKPIVRTKDFVLTYDTKSNDWELVYKSIPFNFPKHDIHMPEVSELDKYLSWVEIHSQHIQNCVKEMFDGYDEHINISSSHVAQVSIEDPGYISVMVLGDDTWGDMGYDLWIKDGVIINEGAGD